MAALLLLIIYIAFIGLGIPDSLFGAARPAIYTEFGIPVSGGSLITMLISGGTIISSLLSAELIRRFGTGRITAFSTSLTAAALFGFSCSGNLLLLCLFAVPLGLGAGAIDTALNNYVALHYRASHMNFLHCFYGIGVSLSPLLMSLALSAGSWRNGYRTVFWLQAGIAVLTILALPLWKRVSAVSGQEEEAAETVRFSRLLRDSRVRMACLVFIGSCGLEYSCGNWGSTFLVTSRGLEADAGAGTGTVSGWPGQWTGLSKYAASDSPDFWKKAFPVRDGCADGGLLCGYSAGAGSVRRDRPGDRSGAFPGLAFPAVSFDDDRKLFYCFKTKREMI